MDYDVFDDWNIIKKDVHSSDKNKSLFFNEKEVWWVTIGINIGLEIYGKGSSFTRPVLILKKLSNDLAIVIPMTTKNKKGTWFVTVYFQKKYSTVLLYQIKIMDKKRFQHKIGNLDQQDYLKVKEKLKLLLEFF